MFARLLQTLLRLEDVGSAASAQNYRETNSTHYTMLRNLSVREKLGKLELMPYLCETDITTVTTCEH